MSTTETEAFTQADMLRTSPAVRGAIDAIVGELKERQRSIEGVRGPSSDAARVSYEELMSSYSDLRGRGLLYPYIGSGFGRGPYVELADGSVKLDLITGIGVHFFGHSDPDLVGAAVEAATSNTPMQGHLIGNRESVEFARVLTEEARRTSRLKHVFLCNSGAMANENAIKVCYQKHAPASRVAAFAHCFMGRTVTMAQIGDNPAGRQGLPLSTQVDYVPFYDHVAARRMSAGDVSGPTRYIDMARWHLEQYFDRYPGQHACFIFELVQGEGGFNTALPDYHKALMETCKAYNVAVWADEVQTFGRTERMFCYDALGLGEWVDVACVGKMSQVCAALFTEEYNPKPGLLSGTFLGNSVSLKVGTRVLEKLLSGGFYGENGKIRRHHDLFIEKIRALEARHPEWFPHTPEVHDTAAGYGGMMRFTPFRGAKDAILKLCHVLFEEGLIAFYCGHGPYHVRFLPPIGAMEERDWDAAMEIVERSMARVAAEGVPAEEPKLRPMKRPYSEVDYEE